MKNQKGITLIALVITIIVLLILAGVSIAMLAGDNGVLTKASDSKIVNAIGAMKDTCALAASEALADYYDSIYLTNNSSPYTPENLRNAIKAAINAVKDDADVEVKDVGTDYTFIIDSKAKPSTGTGTKLYTTGTITEQGGITWVDHFKGE